VAYIVGKAQAQERQRHPAAFAFLAHKQQHPAAEPLVVDVALPGGGGFAGEALALPVELPWGDGVVVVAGGGGEQSLTLFEGDEEDVAAGGFIEEHSLPAGEGAALVSANRSRGVLKAQSDRRGVVIAELQRELVALGADLADEARAKARLHALNAKLGTVIRELEETGDAMVGLIDESERQSGFWIVEMFRRLIEQATRWRTVKAKAAALAAEAGEETNPSNQLGGQP
jgi:hypothetical protein